MAKNKPLSLDKDTMNIIIRKMARMQNKKDKLNAGQLREVVSLFIKAASALAEDKNATSFEVV